MGQKLKFDLEKNAIVCGDCCNEEGKGWLNFIPDNSIDLIYIDPPFFSNKNYEIVWGNGFEERSFGDRWKGGKRGIEHYIEWMKPKLKEAKRVLTNTGSIFLHCDKNANWKIRELLNKIFGSDRFVNEIIWHYKKWTNSPRHFQRNHDTIFFYSKSKQYKFNKLYQSYANTEWVEDTVRIIENGKLKRAKDKQGNYIKRTKENKGVPMHDVFNDIEDLDFIEEIYRSNVIDNISFGATNKERIGYGTQKPEKLIKRIIECSTEEGNIVLDFFGGGGTTAKVCANSNRKFIIGDVSPVAVRVTADRLSANGYRNYEIKALPSTKKEYLDMNPHKFADMICELMGWKPNVKKSNDGGIDGFANKGNIPIQIKNHKNKTGRPDIQRFLGAINKYEKGFFVSWGFSPDAWEFKASVKDKKIEFIELGKILNGLLISDDISTEHKKLYKERVKKSFKEAIKAKKSELQKEKEEIQKEKRKSAKKRRKSSNNS